MPAVWRQRSTGISELTPSVTGAATVDGTLYRTMCRTACGTVCEYARRHDRSGGDRRGPRSVRPRHTGSVRLTSAVSWLRRVWGRVCGRRRTGMASAPVRAASCRRRGDRPLFRRQPLDRRRQARPVTTDVSSAWLSSCLQAVGRRRSRAGSSCIGCPPRRMPSPVRASSSRARTDHWRSVCAGG